MVRLKKNILPNYGTSVPLEDVTPSDWSNTDSIINEDYQGVDLDSALNGSSSKINSTPLADRVRNSPNYKIAYNLFFPYRSSSPEWLAQLEAVPTMVDDSDPTWFDKHGWTNNYDDKQDSAYQFCMEYISNLIHSFHQWRNSLPSTQANQFAQVGYNSAITGQGIDGSSVGDIDKPSADPSSISSVNPLDFVDNIGSLFTNFNTGVIGYLTSLSNLDISRRQLELDGLKFAFEKDKITGDQLLSWLGLSKQFLDTGYTDVDLPTPKIVGHSVEDYKISSSSSERAYGASLKAQADSYDEFARVQSHPAHTVPSLEYSKALQHWSRYRFDTWKKQQEFDRAKLEYEKALYEGLDPSIYTDYQNKMFKYERELFDMKFKYVNELYEMQKQPGNHTAQYLFNYVMSGGYDIGLQHYREETNDLGRANMIGNTVLGGLNTLGNGIKMFIPGKKK